MQFYIGLLIVCYFFYFTYPFIFKVQEFVAPPIFAATALIGAAIKSSDLFLKKLNSR